MRVVSLLPSATDTVVALGLQRLLVGRSHECDLPEVASRPVLTESKLGIMEDCGVIDQAMATSKAGLADTAMWMPEEAQLEMLMSFGLAVYSTRMQQLRDLQPDVILTQLQELPGWLPTDAHQQWRSALEEYLGRPCQVVHLVANSLEEVWGDMQAVAGAVGAAETGQELVEETKRRMRVASQLTTGRPRPRVVCVQWPDPWFAAGSWVPELIRMAGGNDVIGREDEAVQFSEQQLTDSSPEVLLFALCGFDLQHAVAETRKALKSLRGTGRAPPSVSQSGRIAAFDGTQLFSRPGPLLADTLEALVEVLHPEAQQFGHEGHKWSFVS